MKYKVGDKVRVRSDLFVDEVYGGWYFDPEMSSKKGVILTVDDVDSNDYYIMDDGSEYWTDEMLEDVDEEFKLPEKWYIIIKTYEEAAVYRAFFSNKTTLKWDYALGYKYGWNGRSFEAGCELGLLITFDQFKKYVLKESESTPKFESKFVKGRWYKNPKHWSSPEDFCKFSGQFKGNLIGYTDNIIKGIPYFGSTGYWCYGDLCTEATAEEIQQYLPENHPDKLKKRAKKAEDLKYPDAVHCSSKEQHDKVKQFANIEDYEGSYYYLIGACGRREKPWDGTCGSNSESRTTYTNYEFSDIIFPEEKVETKPMLSKEELLAEAKRRYPVGTKYKNASGDSSNIFVLSGDDWSDSLLDDVVYAEYGKGCLYYKGNWAEIISKPTVEEEVIDVPEYIECIEGFSDYIIPGLIYKVIDKTHINSIILRCNITSNLSAGSNLYVSVWSFAFKPSTKEAFDRQGKSSVKEKEGLVQTGMSQSQACDSCKYNDNCGEKGFFCMATGGQHYPKDNSSERYIVAADPFDDKSSSSVIGNGKFPLYGGMGLYEQMEKIHMQTYFPIGFTGGIYNLPISPEDCFDSDEIYVPIIKTEVKQIKL